MSVFKDISSHWYNKDGSFNFQDMRLIFFTCATSIESCEIGLRFCPRSTDIIVSTPPKCGTTWTNQIVHQLRTGGDSDMVCLHEVVPWLESAHDRGIDLDAEQKGETPIRVYKTHSPYDVCPKGAKYIAVFRNPCNAAYSYYKFYLGKVVPEDLPLDEFVSELYLKMGDAPFTNIPWDVSYFQHLLSWVKHKNDPNCLILFYEEMKENLGNVVRAIASFIGVDNEDIVRNAVRMSSFEYMKANHEKFDGTVPNPDSTPSCYGPREPVTFVLIRSGSLAEAGHALSHETKSMIQKRWENEVTKVTGYLTYDELRHGIRKECPLKY